MKFEEMIAALGAKREVVEIKGFNFYVRAMTVEEFGKFFFMEDQTDNMILKCIENEDGSPVFENIEQVKQLYTTVRAQLSAAVSAASVMKEETHAVEKN
ncbi:TPA: cytochrome [Citrobacter freundii]|nr:cytochrome [Citrobacter freundii]